MIRLDCADVQFTRKYHRNLKRHILSTLVFSSAIMSDVFPSLPASAQQISPPKTPAFSDPDYCKQSTLTGVAFMQSIHAIITHGDLTDTAFIEKAFSTKFSSPNDVKATGTPAPESSIYGTDQILGYPIYAELYINHSRDRQSKYSLIGRMSIGNQAPTTATHDFLVDCLRISASTFSSYFGGGFLYINPIPDSLSEQRVRPPTIFSVPYTNADQQTSDPGKNDSKIYLRFSFDTEDKTIFDVGIFQQP